MLVPPIFAEVRDGLIGLPVSHVWRGYGSSIFVEFGALRPSWKKGGMPGEPQGEMALMVEGSWRIEGANTILCGSFSYDEECSGPLDQLVGARVDDLLLFGRLPEVEVRLSGDLHVLTFSTDIGEPEWVLFDRRHSAERSLCVENGQIMISTVVVPKD